MKTIVMATGLCLLMVGSLAGQSAALIDDILAEDRLTYGSAAYLLLGLTEQIDEEQTRAEAVETLAGLESGLSDRSAEDPINLGELSLLIMQVFEIEGGLFYRIVQDGRYAARELEFRRVIQGEAFPTMRVNGERGLRILNRAVALREEGRI